MMSQPPPIPSVQGFLDAVDLFERLGIGYALIGGVAAMYYGRARFTEDLDFVAVTGHQQTLATHADEMRQCRFDPGCTYKLYHDSGLQIDLWKDEHADAIVARAVTGQLAGRAVRIAELHDLIAMKLRAGRPQDDYDISEIVRQTPIDDARLRTLVDEEQFGRYEAIRRRVTRA